ncbi:MAG: TIR domain-containing protein [Butyrivibrio sp.]|nr:TIR domain-containing protein [Butyrivibrio sp.]
MNKVDNPKVFISYAWGSQEYQNKVVSFATSLSNDGIEVVLDKWSMVAGNDLNNFMEKSVKDPSITNVIILLDENYAKKADDRSGGVGTETQIISPMIYAATEQDKFVPVIFERNIDGGVCKPVYLQGRLHYDLSDEDRYASEYRNLVRHLYGVETYRKPEIGKKPSWVDEQIEIKPLSVLKYDSLKKNNSEEIKKEQLEKFLLDIENRIVDYSVIKPQSDSLEDYLQLYSATSELRCDFLEIVRNSLYVKSHTLSMADFFERTYNRLDENTSIGNEICKVFLHELFLYFLAWLLKRKQYKDMGYVFGRTYFKTRAEYGYEYGHTYNMFYSGSLHTNLDRAVCQKDNKKYYSGTANYWISNIDIDFCTKEDFVFADLIAYNYSIYGTGYKDDWKWFPVTYVYDKEFNSRLGAFARQLVSKEKLENAVKLFNYQSEEEMIESFKEIEEKIHHGEYKDYRYPNCFESAQIIGYFVKAEDMGSVN